MLLIIVFVLPSAQISYSKARQEDAQQVRLRVPVQVQGEFSCTRQRVDTCGDVIRTPQRDVLVLMLAVRIDSSPILNVLC